MHDRQECESALRERVSKTSETKTQPQDGWTRLIGRSVEIFEYGRLVDAGRVEEVTSDGLILWLEMYGAKSRRLIEKSPAKEVRVL